MTAPTNMERLKMAAEAQDCYSYECSWAHGEIQELLEALQAIMGWYGLGKVQQVITAMGEQAEYCKTLRLARAAIARATGE